MNKLEPKVTIVTITFNLKKAGREKYFRQCVKSVHDQSYKNVEHLIVDGASTDGTLELIKEYKDKGWVRCVSEPDTGIYNAMNKALKLASGKYIAFLNSDDFYHNRDAIMLSVNALENKSADFSYANYIVTGSRQRYIERGDLERFLYIMPFGHPTMFAKKSVLMAEGGFDESLGLPADYDLIIRLILKGFQPTYIDSEIATYRLGGLGSTNDHSNEIAKVYLKNYSQFYNFSNQDQAKKIMYQGIVPKTFPIKFARFARKQKLSNMDLEKVLKNLEPMVPQAKISKRIIVEKIKKNLKRTPLVVKLWKILK